MKLTAEGIFFNYPVSVLGYKNIVIYCPSHITKENFDCEFKPICDKIAIYLRDEGFINSKNPHIQIKRIKN